MPTTTATLPALIDDAELERRIDALVTEDDTPLDNFFSEKQQRLLTEPLYSSWSVGGNGKPRNFVAAANIALYATSTEAPLVPDVMLSLDVTVPEDWWKQKNRSYMIFVLGKGPEVVIEIVSNRKGGELTGKLDDYERIGIPSYVVFDPTHRLSRDTLRVYALTARANGTPQGRSYVLQKSHDFPALSLGLKLWEGVFERKKETWLRWCDLAGKLIPTGAERAEREAGRAEREAGRAKREAQKAKQEAERAALEADRADRAAERAAHETERADHAAERASIEAERAEREAGRAEREAERAERLAAKLRELGIDPTEL